MLISLFNFPLFPVVLAAETPDKLAKEDWQKSAGNYQRGDGQIIGFR